MRIQEWLIWVVPAQGLSWGRHNVSQGCSHLKAWLRLAPLRWLHHVVLQALATSASPWNCLRALRIWQLVPQSELGREAAGRSQCLDLLFEGKDLSFHHILFITTETLCAARLRDKISVHHLMGKVSRLCRHILKPAHPEPQKSLSFSLLIFEVISKIFTTQCYWCD